MSQRIMRPTAATRRHPPADSASAAQLSFRRTVPRDLVHRAAVAEVFLVDALQVDCDRFLVAAQWPRDHALYSPAPDGMTDPLLFAETIRQSLVYLAHRFRGIPLGHHFVGCDLEFEIDDPGRLRVGPQPLGPVLEARWIWLGNRPPQRYEMRLEVLLTLGGLPCGRGSLHVITLDERRYELLRRRSREQPPTPVVPAPRSGGDYTRVAAPTVGRLRAKDSVLERDESSDRWRLRVDPDHAILFDHPSDHIPLMVELEGFRQIGHALVADSPSAGATAVTTASAASAASASTAATSANAPTAADQGSGRSLRAVQVDCLAFGELDEPVSLVIEENRPGTGPGASHLLRVAAVQRGRAIARATMDWRPDEPADAG